MSVKEVNNLPLVSVVMPAYNAERYISKAIESILNQTYSVLELIIVEDCSTDNTLREILKFSDNRIRLLKNDVNRGIAYSTNRAIKESRGKYIALMDDDDVASIYRLSLTVDFLEKNRDISIVGGGGVRIDEFGNYINKFPIPRHNSMIVNSMLLFDNCMINGTVMYRKDDILKNNIWYKDGYCGLQDFQFYMEASKLLKLSNIPQCLIYYRLHHSNESIRQSELNLELKIKCESQIQRDSIRLSGFKLKEDELSIINKIITCYGVNKYSLEDINKLYEVFSKMIKQAKEYNLMGVDELKWVMHKYFCDKLQRCDIFESIF
jgi:glycosyltransferase involved in cell wall biosynthesis